VTSSAARRSRSKASRVTSAASSASLMSSVSNSRLTPAASTGSLTSTCPVNSTVASDTLMPTFGLAVVGSASSLMSMSRLDITQSSDSMMSETSRSCVDAGKFDFSAVKTELSQSCMMAPSSHQAMSEMSQPASDMVKFHVGQGTEFLSPNGTGSSAVDRKPVGPDVDSNGGRTDILAAPKTEELMPKSVDRKSEKMETGTEMVKDEVMLSQPDSDVKTPAAAASQGNTDIEVSTELKPGVDKPCTGADAVATSNVTSTSTTAAGTVSAGGSEVTAIASASDLKKESQAINYDWVCISLFILIATCLLCSSFIMDFYKLHVSCNGADLLIFLTSRSCWTYTLVA